MDWAELDATAIEKFTIQEENTRVDSLRIGPSLVARNVRLVKYIEVLWGITKSVQLIIGVCEVD